MPGSSLRGRRVLVSGAGVAGPAAAFWLTEHGAEVTVVEVAPALRTSGFAVDFRGPTHLGVLERMGVLDDLRAVQTHGGAVSCVDERGQEIFRLPAEFAGGEVEVLRRDLSRILYEHTVDRAEYVFGDRVTALTQHAGGVDVEFAGGTSGSFDLVVGADGMHSGVRAHAFGAEHRFVRHLGYYLAQWDLPNDLGEEFADGLPRQYNTPGRMANLSADLREPSVASAMVVFASPRLDVGWRDLDAQKTAIRRAMAGMGWHVPRMLDALPAVEEMYFDAISKVRMPTWHHDRVVLLGDAGYGVTLGGMGVGTSVVGAYVLAGELAAAGGDHRVAFPAYQRRLRSYADRWQRGANPGRFLAPATSTGLWVRDRVFSSSLGRRMLVSTSNSLANTLALPGYPT